MALFTSDGLAFLLRWIHLLAGVTWIGLLYYFNVVQVPFMGQAGTEAARPLVVRMLVPRALWWFRWGAMFTFLSGTFIILWKMWTGGAAVLSTSWGIAILTGALFGTIMFLNVWLVIWPNQQVVIASAEAVAGGGTADPAAAGAGARAFLASRTNTLFSIPMLFFMGAASHLPLFGEPSMNVWIPYGIVVVIAAAIEAIALTGKKGEGPAKLFDQHTNVIYAGLGLSAVVYALIDLML